MKNIKKISYIKEDSLVNDIYIVSNVNKLKEIINKPFICVGNMSKTICGYNLLNTNIIKSEIKDVYIEKGIIKVGSGILLSELDNLLINKNIKNFNMLRTIPGTIGGAISMNASFLNESISENLLAIEGIDNENKYKKIDIDKLIFSYRKSNIKDILKMITYAYFKPIYSSRNEIKQRINKAYEYRLKQPKIRYTLGSTFKNHLNFKAYEIISKINKTEYKTFKIDDKHKNFLNFYPNSKGYEIRNDLLSLKNNIIKETGICLDFEINFLYDLSK